MDGGPREFGVLSQRRKVPRFYSGADESAPSFAKLGMTMFVMWYSHLTLVLASHTREVSQVICSATSRYLESSVYE
jgi:hypothetical protein